MKHFRETVEEPFWEKAGRHWSEEADRYDAMLGPVQEDLLAAARPQTAERVLDVGCGTGALTRAVADLVGSTGTVIGLDVSSTMLDGAMARTSNTSTNILWHLGDASTASVGHSVDLLLSRYGLMFFADRPDAFVHLASQVRPGGRMAFAVWRTAADNAWISLPVEVAERHLGPLDLLGPTGPFALSNEAVIAGHLQNAGLLDVDIRRLDHQARIGSDVEDTIGFFMGTEMGTIWRSLPPELGEKVRTDLAVELAKFETPEGIVVPASSWIVTAHRPGLGQ